MESHPPSRARCNPIPLYAWHATFFCQPCVSSTMAFNSSTVSVGCETRFPCLSTHERCVMYTLSQSAPCSSCCRAALRASTAPPISLAPLCLFNLLRLPLGFHPPCVQLALAGSI